MNHKHKTLTKYKDIKKYSKLQMKLTGIQFKSFKWRQIQFMGPEEKPKLTFHLKKKKRPQNFYSSSNITFLDVQSKPEV